MYKKLIHSTFWSINGQVGYLIIGLVGNIILTRLLSADEFGLVGIAMFFVSISNVLVESGIGGALIRKKEATEKDFSTVFVFNLVVSLILFLSIFFTAGYIANYYGIPKLKHVLWSLSLLLIINAFTITQNVKLIKSMKFKEIGIYKFISFLCATIIAIYFAYLGYGVWAIVIMQLLSAFFMMSILWIRERAEISFKFSKESFKEVYSFGIFTTFSSILNIGFDNIYQLIFVRYFSVSQVGYYYQAKKLYQAPDNLYRNIIYRVLYSYLSNYQDNQEEFRKRFNLIAKVSVVIICFSLLMVFLYAEQIILLLYGSKWIESSISLKLLTIAGFFTLLEIINRNIFKIYNKTHKIFFLEVVKKVIQTITIVVGIYYLSLELLLWGLVVTSIISYFINTYYAYSMIHQGFISGIKPILKIVIIAIISGFVHGFLIKELSLEGNRAFFLMPLLFIIYGGLLVLWKVINITQLKRLKKGL